MMQNVLVGGKLFRFFYLYIVIFTRTKSTSLSTCSCFMVCVKNIKCHTVFLSNSSIQFNYVNLQSLSMSV